MVVAASASPPPPPASFPDTESLAGFAVCAALFRAAQALCEDVRRILRTVVLACAAEGWELRGGYRLIVVRVVRKAATTCGDAHYRETVLFELRREGGSSVQRVTAEHGRVSHTLKWLCGSPPGPRYAWPGPMRSVAAADGRPSRKRGRVVAVTDALREAIDRTVRLAAATPAIRAAFGAHHPLLGHTETADVIGQLWDRLTGICRETAQVCEGLGAAIVRRADTHTIAAFNRQCATIAAPPPSVGVVPEPLLVAYGGIVADLQFLRRAEEMHRSRLIGAMETRKRLDVPLAGANLPDVTVRLSSRRIVNWRRVYAALWPQKYRSEETARRRADNGSIDATAGTEHYASRIEFLPD